VKKKREVNSHQGGVAIPEGAPWVRTKRTPHRAIRVGRRGYRKTKKKKGNGGHERKKKRIPAIGRPKKNKKKKNYSI